MDKIKQLADLLFAASAKLNLFSAQDRNLIESKHLPDSLAFLGLNLDLNGLSVIDLGTGGGLPGLALAISFPRAKFTLVDSRAKKIKVVADIAEDLGLSNVVATSGRLEDLAHNDQYREKFDVAICRALADLPVLLEYAAGFLPVGGLLVAWKGASVDEELSRSEKAIGEFGFELKQKFQYNLDGIDKRELLVFSKIAKTKMIYPRSAPVPRKSPII